METCFKQFLDRFLNIKIIELYEKVSITPRGSIASRGLIRPD